MVNIFEVEDEVRRRDAAGIPLTDLEFNPLLGQADGPPNGTYLRCSCGWMSGVIFDRDGEPDFETIGRLVHQHRFSNPAGSHTVRSMNGRDHLMSGLSYEAVRTTADAFNTESRDQGINIFVYIHGGLDDVADPVRAAVVCSSLNTADIDKAARFAARAAEAAVLVRELNAGEVQA